MQATEVNPREEPGPSPAEVRDMRPGRRILVADDDADMRRFLCLVLRRAGYRVAAVGDVMDAIEFLASPGSHEGGRIHAIVSDVRMPGLSGLDFLALLRGTSVDVPVVLVSAFHDEATRTEARSLGAAAVLDKPVDGEALASAVDAVVDRPARRDRPTAPSVHLRLCGPSGRGVLVRVASLRPYDLEELADDARRAARGAQLEIGWRGEATAARRRLAPLLARLADRGVEVRVLTDVVEPATAPSRTEAPPPPPTTGRYRIGDYVYPTDLARRIVCRVTTVEAGGPSAPELLTIEPIYGPWPPGTRLVRASTLVESVLLDDPPFTGDVPGELFGPVGDHVRRRARTRRDA